MENHDTAPGRVFGRRVRETREVLGLTQTQLADLVRAHDRDEDGAKRWRKATISEIERGTRRVDVQEALVIALVLDVAPCHLFAPFAGILTVGEVEMEPAEARAWITGTSHHHLASLFRRYRFRYVNAPPERKKELDETKAYVHAQVAKGGKWPLEPGDEDSEDLQLLVMVEILTEGTMWGRPFSASGSPEELAQMIGAEIVREEEKK